MKKIIENIKLHRVIIDLDQSIKVLLFALHCMQIQATVHEIEAVRIICSIATAAEYQVTLGGMQLHKALQTPS